MKHGPGIPKNAMDGLQDSTYEGLLASKWAATRADQGRQQDRVSQTLTRPDRNCSFGLGHRGIGAIDAER